MHVLHYLSIFCQLIILRSSFIATTTQFTIENWWVHDEVYTYMNDQDRAFNQWDLVNVLHNAKIIQVQQRNF